MTKTINLAFVGTGPWARKQHFPALDYVRAHAAARFDVRLHGIFSLERADAKAVAAQYGFARVYDSLDALIADGDVDAVAMAVPPGVAASVAEKLAAKGVPLFSEKPPGISTAQAQRLSAVVTVPNVLAFNRRFAPLNVAFKDIVDEMKDIYFVEGHFFRHNRLDETFMIGTGIHWINFMEHLFGEIVRVRSDRFPNPQNASWVRVGHLTFERGLKGILKVFPCSGSPDIERVEVHSPAQSAYLLGPRGDDPGEIVVDAGPEHHVIRPEALPSEPEIVRVGIVGEYEAFFDAVCYGAPTRSTFQNAVNSMRVAEAMERGEDLP